MMQNRLRIYLSECLRSDLRESSHLKDVDDALNCIEHWREEMTQFMVDMLKMKAVNPDGGGNGEYARALSVQRWLEKLGLKVERHDLPDARVPEGVRVSLTSVLDGVDTSRTLWFVAHLDTVPEGARELWASDPYEPVVKDGKIFGRGSQDNGQSIVSTLFALKAVKLQGVKPRTNVGVAYVSDEESTSNFGVIPLLEKNVFAESDMCIVPDFGTPDGSSIEVAEKGLLWLKIATKGKQVHSSTPEKGLNAHRVGLSVTLEIDKFLHSKYVAADPLFSPSLSTFEPTKSECSVDNVNTVPGLDVQYFDCRVLPQYSLKEVMQDIESIKKKSELETHAQIDIVRIQYEESSAPTPPDCEVVQKLKTTIKKLRGIDAKPIGIGGGTVAAYFRRKGIHTAAWGTTDETAHQPNEYCKIENMLNDAKVFAHVAVN
jgi:succinyl-diaminopimelate desuccinylase